jgi:hypothetical protein
LIAGAILLPGVGALLGWSLPPTRRPPRRAEPLPAWVPPFVVAWIVVQAVVPLRHFFIEGDVNWTQEGELFSWRVKGHFKDYRHPHFVVEDDRLLSRNGDSTTIDWKRLNLEEVVYVDVDPESLDWRSLPAIVVVFEPLLGERIFFNPYHGGRETPTPPAEGAAWVERFWLDQYGRPPEEVRRCISFQEAFANVQSGLETDPLMKGVQRIFAMASPEVERLTSPRANKRDKRQACARVCYLIGNMFAVPHARSLIQENFALCGPLDVLGRVGRDDDFLVINDSKLLDKPKSVGALRWVKADAWRPVGDEKVLTVLLAWETTPPIDLRSLPKYFVFENPDRGRCILWNPFAELTLLRQHRILTGPLDAHAYALHIADAWNRRFSRRPKVFVDMFLTLNQHPEQRAIDPNVNLAAEPRKAFGRHPWIMALRRAEAP